ncbi:DNA helicase RecD OS=Streptomyces fumanus OX=67302 GN=GCM10018772_46190 PE=4 SV=1 [Streptomyces fumanus]
MHGLVLHTGGEASLAEPAALLCAAPGLGLRAWAASPSPAGRARFAGLLGPGPQEARLCTVAGLRQDKLRQGPDGALDLDLLIVFDAPQLDVESAALLAESLADGARLVLAGDPAVLWSVGPGRVFADLLAARVCPQIASAGPIPARWASWSRLSGGSGELTQVEAPGKEVVIVPVRDAGEAVHRTVQLVGGLGAPRDRRARRGDPGDHARTRRRGRHPRAQRGAEGAAQPSPGQLGGFNPGESVASPRTGPYAARPGGGGRRGGAAAVLRGRDRGSTEGAGGRYGAARVGTGAHRRPAAGGPRWSWCCPATRWTALRRPWIYTAFGRAVRHLSVVQGVEQALPRAVAEITAKPRTARLPVLLTPQVQGPG